MQQSKLTACQSREPAERNAGDSGMHRWRTDGGTWVLALEYRPAAACPGVRSHTQTNSVICFSFSRFTYLFEYQYSKREGKREIFHVLVHSPTDPTILAAPG